MGAVWSAPGPEVEVATGALRGKTEVTVDGCRYHAFMGIPYAKPPVGPLRFKAPEPADPWEGVRDATMEGNPCLQGTMPISPSTITLKFVIGVIKNISVIAHRVAVAKKQSEDCLYLNVFVPESVFPQHGKAKPLRPVLFWVHGGAFKLGDGNPDMLNPDYFAEKDIVVVTVNYRLGPFGFLALGTADVPGNAGLKDQAMALQWTRDNIRAFGGDPDAITVYGESAGGASAHLLSLSPLSKGQMRSVIASSGSGVYHWAIAPRPVDVARSLAKELGIQADNLDDLARGLRAVSGPKLLAATEKMAPVYDDLTNELMFLPVVEPDLPGAFLAEDPVALMRSGQAADVPLLTGICSAEGLVCAMFSDANSDETYQKINERGYYFLPPDLREGLPAEQRAQCVQDILDEFSDGKPFSKDSIRGFIDLYGDVMFMTRQLALVHLHTEAASAASSPLYLYRFDYVGRNNCIKAIAKNKLGKSVPRIPGAAHGDDLCYLGNLRLFPQPHLEPDSPEVTTRRRMVQLWTNFIETGNPTPDGTDQSLIPVQWRPCTPTAQPYLHITKQLALSEDKLFPHQAFWEGLYQKYLGKPLLV